MLGGSSTGALDDIMRLSTPGIVYHPERTPSVPDRYCFSIEGVDAHRFTESLLDDLVPGQEVGLADPESDCSRRIRRSASGYQTQRICHGSFTDPWHDVTRQQAMTWLLPAAQYMVHLRIADGWLYWEPDDKAT